MKILDLSAGNRAVWYNKKNPLCTYLDKRKSVNHDYVADTRKSLARFSKNGKFDLVVFDPPHMNCGPNSIMSKRYGYHKTSEIFDIIKKTSAQVHKVTKKNALMALKWNNHDISLKKVYDLMPQWEPLFGHLTKNGPHSQTYWIMMIRKNK